MALMQPDDEKQQLMKQYNFVITLRQQGFHLINAISQLMLFFAVVIFIYQALQNNYIYVLNITVSTLIIALCIYFYILSKKENNIVYYRFALLLAAVGWFVQPERNIFFSMLYLFAAIIEKQAKFPQEIGVNEEGIIFNSFPKKFHAWNELSNIIIKEGIITVDYKNNKLFQKEIESKVSYDLETEFNEFCEVKLAGG